MENNGKKRFISIRLTESEFRRIQQAIETSACQSQTEYVKKLLLNKPVVLRQRDQSRDDLLECLINIKNKLTLIEDQIAGDCGPRLLEEINEVRVTLFKIYAKC